MNLKKCVQMCRFLQCTSYWRVYRIAQHLSFVLVFICFRQHQFAIRATLLSTETLKSRNIYLDAAMQFMRMTAEVMYTLLFEILPNVMNGHFKNMTSQVGKKKLNVSIRCCTLFIVIFFMYAYKLRSASSRQQARQYPRQILHVHDCTSMRAF